MSKKGIDEDFCQNLPAAERQVIYAVQGPLAAAAIGQKTTVAAWQTKSSWYVVASNDRMIAPALEHALAKKIHATTRTLASSHVPMLAQPVKVADFIVAAAKKAPAKQWWVESTPKKAGPAFESGAGFLLV